MQATGGSITSVVGAQTSVLGGRGARGGVLLYPSSSTSSGRFQGPGVVRCCVQSQAQEKKPRVRKTKEERREMVESFVNTYRVSNNGKFPSVNLTHKEVGGSYYIVREIVRDIIQENRVLGPGGLNAKALSFEDCPDSLELSARHELGQDSLEVLSISDENQDDKDSVLEMSGNDEIFSFENNVINTQQLLGSSGLLDDGFLSNILQNGNVVDARCLETNPYKQDDAQYANLREVVTTSSEKQPPSFDHVSDSYKEIELDSQTDAHEGTTNSMGDEVTISLEPNNVLQQTLLQEDEVLPGSIMSNDVDLADGLFASTTSTNQMAAYNVNTNPGKVVSSKSFDCHDEIEHPLLDASPSKQVKSEGLASQLAMDSKGLLQREGKHNAIEEDVSEFKKSVSGITQEEDEASNTKHEHGINITVATDRRTGRTQKKEDNLFFLIIRAFLVSMSKLWAK